MKPSYPGLLLSILAVLFLGFVGWVYIGGAMTSAAGPDDAAFYPAPYPPQYLPILAVIPVPTEPPPPSPTPPPPPPLPTLHVGLQLRWDGAGHIYFDDYYWNPGTHTTRDVDQQVDADTVRIYAEDWYSPNPFDWEDESCYCHDNTVSNRGELCSAQGDPAWKWGFPWILPTDVTLVSGDTVEIDGQVFNVTGPHTFLTGYGEQVNFWRLVNRDKFLIHYGGGEWKQYVEKGDASLFYEFHDSRMLIFSNVKRSYYKNDKSTANNVRYEDWLTQFEGLVAYAVEMGFITASDEGHNELPNQVEMIEVLESLGVDTAAIGPIP